MLTQISPTFVSCDFYSFDNTTSGQPRPLRVYPVIPRVHPEEPVGVFTVNRDDTTAGPGRLLLRRAAFSDLLGLRRAGAGLLVVPTHCVVGGHGLSEDLRPVTVVETVKPAAFYELTEIISQVRRVKRCRNVANSEIHRSYPLRVRHVCLSPGHPTSSKRLRGYVTSASWTSNNIT